MTYIPDKCPNCGEQELRPVSIGNNRDGWNFTGEFECDGCGENFVPFQKDKVIEELEQKERYDNHDCDFEDGCQTCEDYRNYIDQEVKALNNKY